MASELPSSPSSASLMASPIIVLLRIAGNISSVLPVFRLRVPRRTRELCRTNCFASSSCAPAKAVSNSPIRSHVPTRGMLAARTRCCRVGAAARRSS